jgi:hypothetical protein
VYADGLLPRDVLGWFDLDEDSPEAEDVLCASEEGYSRGVEDEAVRSARAMLDDQDAALSEQYRGAGNRPSLLRNRPPPRPPETPIATQRQIEHLERARRRNRRCSGRTKQGYSCGMPAMRGRRFCFWHDDSEGAEIGRAGAGRKSRYQLRADRLRKKGQREFRRSRLRRGPDGRFIPGHWGLQEQDFWGN